MNNNTSDDATGIRAERVTKIIDFKLPLPYILTALAGLAAVLIGMWSTLSQVSRDLTELQVVVKGGNTQVNAIDRDLARLQWRVDLLEKNTVQRSDLPPPTPGRR